MAAPTRCCVGVRGGARVARRVSRRPLGPVRVAGVAGVVQGGAEPEPVAGPAAALAQLREGLRRRTAADPSFLFKLGTEICVDETITFFVNCATRGMPMMWSPTDAVLVAAQMLTALFNDIFLVWLLAPTAAANVAKGAGGGAAAGGAAAAGAEAEAAQAPEKKTLGHMFEPGDYTTRERLQCWVDKWRFYSVLGAVTAALSMVIALGLSDFQALTWRNVYRAALTGAICMGISSNTRYQIVNGLELLTYRVLPTAVARVSSILIRFCNNILGARIWIFVGSLIGA